ncbi:aspartate aminotransferase family protein [Metabacillus iocasae]|uniref:4-aminobutyrate aminotransferase n=1 Tax=Priestia iocasae TaxID=2291674 RepID=A0ABS2R046_9BACI|nr:aspartate aminotransferase family protein [Metabacillus iocasae]MBM7704356.1 4-aminobutyrate aminotransferase [Metabacillus iocasae]
MLDYNWLNREGDTNHGKGREAWMRTVPPLISEAIEADKQSFFKQSMSTPCLSSIVDAEGCYLIDKTGKKYLDFHGNSLHQVGYKNPYVVEAVTRQLNQLPFIPRRFTADITVEAAQTLIQQTTSHDYCVLFTPSGAAAVGIALKIARKVTGRHKVISMWESFHGAGLDTISIGGEYVFKKEMGPMMPGMIKSIPYNAYRNLFGLTEPEKVAEQCLAYLEYCIEHEGEIGAIVLEPIRATDTHIPPRSYFQRLRELCDRHGILLIFDEIPTAFLRSGSYYVHQQFGVEPDILVLGKGLGGAVVPQAAVLVQRKWDQADDLSLGHYTHEKPALGSAAIVAMTHYLEDYHVKDNVARLSHFVQTELQAMQKRHEAIGDIRVAGLLITIELVQDRVTKEKASKLAEYVLYYCLTKGLSFKVSAGNCITWHPPLIITESQLSEALALLEEALTTYQEA